MGSPDKYDLKKEIKILGDKLVKRDEVIEKMTRSESNLRKDYSKLLMEAKKLQSEQ